MLRESQKSRVRAGNEVNEVNEVRRTANGGIARAKSTVSDRDHRLRRTKRSWIASSRTAQTNRTNLRRREAQTLNGTCRSAPPPVPSNGPKRRAADPRDPVDLLRRRDQRPQAVLRPNGRGAGRSPNAANAANAGSAGSAGSAGNGENTRKRRNARRGTAVNARLVERSALSDPRRRRRLRGRVHPKRHQIGVQSPAGRTKRPPQRQRRRLLL